MWSLDSALRAIGQLNQSTWMGQRLLVTLWHKDEERPYRNDELIKLQSQYRRCVAVCGAWWGGRVSASYKRF